MPKLVDRRKTPDRRVANKHVFEIQAPNGKIIKLYKRVVNRRTIVSSNVRLNKTDRRKNNK
ncbi:MAG: hypothetical protein HON47_01285 [Candidatus Diapherotrites archaeon]|jgi:hypothetical protein|uniref:Uncharacterized protein n=1 Tax=Candidatus Iainarchaeum sp. TaxID=3101447 RepID=A0A8T5GEM1_9ARCH|nr:hypothetical protein [Candidatus Diapherotrites archaeon]MBT7241422.1 hypothetical protein [Candidatus Diapherotrites archaeon]